MRKLCVFLKGRNGCHFILDMKVKMTLGDSGAVPTMGRELIQSHDLNSASVGSHEFYPKAEVSRDLPCVTKNLTVFTDSGK
jgi:hypothetical protein